MLKHQSNGIRKNYVGLDISIKDDGIGISEEGLSKLFVDFGKLQESSNRNQKGTGLGLSICKKIIEKMSGSVQVRSTPNVGTTFTISLKIKSRSLAQSLQDSFELN